MIIIDEQIMKDGTKYILRRMEFNYELKNSGNKYQ